MLSRDYLDSLLERKGSTVLFDILSRMRIVMSTQRHFHFTGSWQAFKFKQVIAGFKPLKSLIIRLKCSSSLQVLKSIVFLVTWARLVFIWNCFVFCFWFLLFYVISAPEPAEGNKVSRRSVPRFLSFSLERDYKESSPIRVRSIEGNCPSLVAIE